LHNTPSQPENPDFIIDNTRIIKLKNIYNFRDVGGLETEHQLSIRQGLLFRSDELSRLTKSGLAIIKQMGIRSIIDLRTPEEILENPDKIPLKAQIKSYGVPIFHHDSELARAEFIKNLIFNIKKIDLEKLIRKHYFTTAFERRQEIGTIIHLLANRENLPALIHCTAGKDRTGYVSAILQLLLGVSYQKVMEDYLLTNTLIKKRVAGIIRLLRWVSLFRLSEDRIRPLLEARKDYLADVIDLIGERFGSIENYLISYCEVSNADIQQIKEIYLERK